MLANSGNYFGASHDNIKSGIHYIVTSSDNYYSPFTVRHELGHGLLRLGDGYEVSIGGINESVAEFVAHKGSETGEMEEYAWISAHLFLSACGWFIYIQFKFHVYYAVKYKQ